MNKFEFINSDIEIEINGEVLCAEVTHAEVEMTAARKLIISFSEKITAGEASSGEIESTIAEVCKKIDTAFGKKSAERIFKDRAVSIHNCLNVVVYIISRLNEFEEGVKSKISSYGSNRAERRAAAKKGAVIM